jgi:hypothetical protein
MRGDRVSRVKRDLLVAALFGLAAAVLVFGLGCLGIYKGIRDISGEASAIYGGDKIEALIAYVDDEGRGLSQRNRAVWALGQLGDERALPVLEKYYTGEPCDHARFLCQDELRKSIRKCRGGVNVTSWVNGFALRAP